VAQPQQPPPQQAYPQQAYPPQQYPPQAYPQQYPPGYQPWRPVPVRVETREVRRIGLGIAGSCIFGGLWLITGVVGYTANAPAAFVPIIGPLFYLSGRDRTDDRMGNAFLILDAIVQAGGVAMAIAGFATKKKVQTTVPVVVAPMVTPAGGGLFAAGTF
jgi:hypothetical protein